MTTPLLLWRFGLDGCPMPKLGVPIFIHRFALHDYYCILNNGSLQRNPAIFNLVLLLRKCRAIWQIARWTIYKIVLQIFIPLGVPKAHGELLRK
ncbi:MAG: hypothetical protein V9G20_16785 [Candidatus Promineifilaceae bacterium]